MNKQEFLEELKNKLSGIPQSDREERLNFYGEMIDDRIEDGLTEEQAVAELGSIDDIVKQIASEIPLTKLVKEKVKPKRSLRAWEIALLAVGAPIWFSLLIALFAIVLSVYIVAWSLIVSVWAIEFSFAASVVGCVFASVVYIVQGSIAAGIVSLGVAVSCLGIAIFGWYGCMFATKGILKLTKRVFIWLKSRFVKRGQSDERKS